MSIMEKGNNEAKGIDDTKARCEWQERSVLSIYSRSRGLWSIGEITEIYIDNATNKEWFIVKYNGKTKHIQRLCKDIKPIDDSIRYSWTIGSICLIYSRSADKWFQGKIFNIYNDASNEEWLEVKYDGNKKKSIQRLCKFIQPLTNTFEGLKQDEMTHQSFNWDDLSDSEVNPTISIHSWQFILENLFFCI